MHIKKYIRRGLGELGTLSLSKLSAALDEVFTVAEAERVLKIKGPRLRKLLHDLAENKWIERVERGKYLRIPLEAGPSGIHGTNPLIIASKLIGTYYVGFASALNYYGITEQVGGTTYIATVKQKKPLQFHAEEYRFIKLHQKRFFGVAEEWIGNSKFNISEKEKTVVDCLFLPKYSGGLTEVVKAFKETLDYEKLYDYALHMDSLSAVKRLGYLLDVLKINPKVVERLLSKVSGGFTMLDTGGKRTGTVNKKWRVIENVGMDELRVELR